MGNLLLETDLYNYLAGQEETGLRRCTLLGKKNRAGQRYTHVPASVLCSRGSSAPRLTDVWTQRTLMAQLTSSVKRNRVGASALLTNTQGWFARSAIVSHHAHPCSSASKVSGGGKVNSPASWQGLKSLPSWALLVCSMGDLLQMSRLRKDAQRA